MMEQGVLWLSTGWSNFYGRKVIRCLPRRMERCMESKVGTLLRFMSPALLLLVGLYTKEFTLNGLEYTGEEDNNLHGAPPIFYGDCALFYSFCLIYSAAVGFSSFSGMTSVKSQFLAGTLTQNTSAQLARQPLL